MIIDTIDQLTPAVLAETERTGDVRTREILQALVRHLHGFAREVRLTEREFDRAIGIIAALGQKTTASHNEVRLMAGSLGLSTLVCLMNNGENGAADTPANLLGPFWRADSPVMADGASLVRSHTPGAPLFFTGTVVDRSGAPIAGAEIDIWHASTVGLYENQDPDQADWNLRGRFVTDAEGLFRFRSIRPAGYPIPIDGPVGQLLAAQERHNLRPAHLHAMIHKAGFKTIASQLYSDDDPVLETDVQFGVTRALVVHYQRHDSGPAPAADVEGAWYSLDYTFMLEPGEARRPPPPVTAKALAAVPKAAEAC